MTGTEAKKIYRRIAVSNIGGLIWGIMVFMYFHIACAKRNPNAEIIGIDHWGPEYRDFTKERCEQNAAAEGVSNVQFRKGDAVKLDFADESFDLVTSNYVYHNIMGKDKQEFLL